MRLYPNVAVHLSVREHLCLACIDRPLFFRNRRNCAPSLYVGLQSNFLADQEAATNM